MTEPTREVADFLQHFGVKGMKWGVRRSKTSAPAHEDASKAAAVAKQVKQHGTHTVSNAELKALTERLNLEQNYSRLVAGNSSEVKRGRDFATELLKDVGKQEAKKYAAKGASAGIDLLIKKASKKP